jgi:hypothetical protein
LRRWLREVENINEIKEMICIYELEVGENVIEEEMRLVDLMNC